MELRAASGRAQRGAVQDAQMALRRKALGVRTARVRL